MLIPALVTVGLALGGCQPQPVPASERAPVEARHAPPSHRQSPAVDDEQRRRLEDKLEVIERELRSLRSLYAAPGYDP